MTCRHGQHNYITDGITQFLPTTSVCAGYTSMFILSLRHWEEFYHIYPKDKNSLQYYPNLSLHHSQTSSFGIQGGICEPQSCGHMLDEAHGLSVLYLWNAHPFNITLLSHLRLLLLGGTRRKEGVGEKNHREVNERRDHHPHNNREREPKMLILTFEARKQKAASLVLAFSGSTTNRPFSSSIHRYRPVVMWRTRKDCPHFMWLPLQLQDESNKNTIY